MVELLTIIEGLSKTLEFATKTRDFVKGFTKRRRRIFEQYIGPTYGLLQPVLTSYEDNIDALRQRLSDASTADEIHKAIENFIADRRKTVQLRSQLMPTLEATAEYLSKLVSTSRDHSQARQKLFAFITELDKYFHAYEFGHDIGETQNSSLDKTITIIESNHLWCFNEAGQMFLRSIGKNMFMLMRHLTDDEELEVSHKHVFMQLCEISLSTLEYRRVSLQKTFIELKLACVEGR